MWQTDPLPKAGLCPDPPRAPSSKHGVFGNPSPSPGFQRRAETSAKRCGCATHWRHAGLGGMGCRAQACGSGQSGGGSGVRIEPRLGGSAGSDCGLPDWAAVSCILSGLRAAATGRPGYPPSLMMWALLLAQWHRLSDPELEEALADRLSSRRVARCRTGCRTGPPCVASAAPWQPTAWPRGDGRDRAPAWRPGPILRTGTIIDASVVEAAVHRPERVNAPSTHDRDARWLSHGQGRIRFGDKAHLCVDQGSGLIARPW